VPLTIDADVTLLLPSKVSDARAGQDAAGTAGATAGPPSNRTASSLDVAIDAAREAVIQAARHAVRYFMVLPSLKPARCSTARSLLAPDSVVNSSA
jgi:hypothetical protein